MLTALGLANFQVEEAQGALDGLLPNGARARERPRVAARMDARGRNACSACIRPGRGPAVGDLNRAERDASRLGPRRTRVGLLRCANEQKATMVGRPGAQLDRLLAARDTARMGLTDGERFHRSTLVLKPDVLHACRAAKTTAGRLDMPPPLEQLWLREPTSASTVGLV